MNAPVSGVVSSSSQPPHPISRNLAIYTIKESSIPVDLQIPEDWQQTINATLNLPNFEFEMDLLDKYAEIKSKNLKEEPRVVAAITTNVYESSTSLNNNSGNKHEDLVTEMMNRLNMKETRDTCYYYLESSEWDINTAMQLYQTT